MDHYLQNSLTMAKYLDKHPVVEKYSNNNFALGLRQNLNLCLSFVAAAMNDSRRAVCYCLFLGISYIPGVRPYYVRCAQFAGTAILSIL
ncbi:hypothetical protein NQ318_016926 [Aromia moschata]|uniref:Uncharacterized protein n=1 Tax=Aromia moschata TaxID=1265417 RepID=A0AAV8X5H8_9CUCU|nr:hypothetical protein NQ318_016926 [Aromia moschata]